MDRLIYTAMTGATQTMGRQAAVAHNLANVTSTGYRAEEHRLRAVPVQSQQRAGAAGRRAPSSSMPARTPTSRRDRCNTPAARSTSPSKARAGSRWRCPTAARPTRATAASNCRSMASCKRAAAFRCRAMAVRSPFRRTSRSSSVADGTVSVIPESGAQNTVNAIGRIKLVNPPEAELVRGDDGLFRTRRRRSGAGGRERASWPAAISKAATSIRWSRW